MYFVQHVDCLKLGTLLKSLTENIGWTLLNWRTLQLFREIFPLVVTFLAISKRASKDEGWHKWERLVGRLSSCCLGWAHLPSKQNFGHICQVNKTLASWYLVLRGILVVFSFYFLVLSDHIEFQTNQTTTLGGWEGRHYSSLCCVYLLLVSKYQTRRWNFPYQGLAMGILGPTQPYLAKQVSDGQFRPIYAFYTIQIMIMMMIWWWS